MLAAKRQMKEEIVGKLGTSCFEVMKACRDSDGWRLELRNGAVVHCFADGSYVVHGPGAAQLRFILRSRSFLGLAA